MCVHARTHVCVCARARVGVSGGDSGAAAGSVMLELPPAVLRVSLGDVAICGSFGCEEPSQIKHGRGCRTGKNRDDARLVIPDPIRDLPCSAHPPVVTLPNGFRLATERLPAGTRVTQHPLYGSHVAASRPHPSTSGRVGPRLHAALRHQAPCLVRSARNDGSGNRTREADQALAASLEIRSDSFDQSDVARSGGGFRISATAVEVKAGPGSRPG